MTPTHKTDYVDEGLDRLIQIAKDDPVLVGLVTPWLAQIQKVEDAAWEVSTLRYLDTASGVQQDVLGLILGVPRGNRSDADYKIALSAEILINRAEGIPGTLEDILQLCCPVPYVLSERVVARLRILLTEPVTFDLPTLFDILMRAKAAGVQLEVEWSPDVDPFLFADYDPTDPDYATPVFDTVHGFADDALTMGGRLAAVEIS